MSKRGGTFRAWQKQWRAGWSREAPTAQDRRQANLDMMFFDHGIARLVWRNFHKVHDDVWRSSQPDPAMIARLAARGFCAVLNLRGDTGHGAYYLEKQACERHGLDLVDIKLHSRELPELRTLCELDTIFSDIARPFVMHCKSGADRSGFAAALYLLLRTDVPVTEAKRQLSARYLHFRRSRAGVLDFMLDTYEAAWRRSGIGFRDWIFSKYDPEAIAAHFHSDAAADFLMDRVLHRE